MPRLPPVTSATLPSTSICTRPPSGGEPSLTPMLRIQSYTFDAHDPQAIANFWEAALGWRRTYDDPEEVVLEPPAGSPEDGVVPDVLFVKVDDDKVVKNRIHLDLRPADRDAEVARLEALGATRVSIGQGDEVTWVVLADPDGNEFCVLRALRPDEMATGSP